MERIAKDGMWLTKKPSNERCRFFHKRITAPTQEAADAYEEVTDEYKKNYEQWLSSLRKKEAEEDDEE